MKKSVSVIVLAVLLAVAMLPFAFSASAEDTWTEEEMMWVTHFNSATEEGAGVIITTQAANISQSWRINIAFAPVEDKDGVYEIVDVVDYLSSTAGEYLVTVPDGGFVYQINLGNDYPSLGAGYEGKPDYTSDNCNNAVATAQGWAIGDQFMFTNLDLEGLTASTSTPDLKWYEDDYVCTTTFKMLVASSVLPTESDPVDDEESAPAEDSVPAEDNNEESDSAVESSEGNDTVSDAKNGSLWIYIVAGVAAVVVVAVVVVLVTKKK